MPLVRTNITLPQEILDKVDDVAGPRGRSRYLAEVIARQVQRDHARRTWEERAGVLRSSTSWGRDGDEVLQTLRELRDDSRRDRRTEP